MEPERLAAILEELLDQLGVEVRREALPDEARIDGGLVTLSGVRTVYLAIDAPPREQSRVLLAALRRLDLSDRYVPPIVRALLEG